MRLNTKVNVLLSTDLGMKPYIYIYIYIYIYNINRKMEGTTVRHN